MFYKKSFPNFSKKILVFSLLMIAMLWLMGNKVMGTTMGTVRVTATVGGETSMKTDDQTNPSIKVPPNAVTYDTMLYITPWSRTDILLSMHTRLVPSDKQIVGKYIYDFYATFSGVEVTTIFKAATISLTYTDNQIEGLNESTLIISYWHTASSEWIVLDTNVDSENNILTATTTYLDYFAILGEELIEEEEVEEEEVAEEEIIEEEVEEEEVEEKPISGMTIEELKEKIVELQQKIIDLLAQMIQIIQSQIAEF